MRITFAVGDGTGATHGTVCLPRMPGMVSRPDHGRLQQEFKKDNFKKFKTSTNGFGLVGRLMSHDRGCLELTHCSSRRSRVDG